MSRVLRLGTTAALGAIVLWLGWQHPAGEPNGHVPLRERSPARPAIPASIAQPPAERTSGRESAAPELHSARPAPLTDLPEGAARQEAFRARLDHASPEICTELAIAICAATPESDWQAEASMLVERWCAVAPVDATLWLLQQGARLDTNVAAEAARTLAKHDQHALGLLLKLAPPQWSRESLLAAAIRPLVDRSPDTAMRWFAELPADAPYRAVALQAVAAELERRH